MIPQKQLLIDQQRERNDTIPEEPTISMDEFQSNGGASFTADPTFDPSVGGRESAVNSKKTTLEKDSVKVLRSGTHYIDSESIQKQ